MAGRRIGCGDGGSVRSRIGRAVAAVFLGLAMVCLAPPQGAQAQQYSFANVEIEGNQRVDASTILSYAGIARGQPMSAAALNDAYQRIAGSGQFEAVELVPSGGTLVIRVREYPTINRVAFEGNARLRDEMLAGVVKSQPRAVYSPAQAEADAAALAEAYAGAGRTAATVTPKIIRRPDNRVDLVFEVMEGRVTEIERISFVGNRAFSDRRLRNVLQTKQAGFLRNLIQRDTFVPERIEFDKQVLTDFYRSRGYVDFEVLGVATEFSRERDAHFITFTVREGQPFRFGRITTTSEVEGLDAAEFQRAVRIRTGAAYSPTAVDSAISRMEALVVQKGLTFIRVEPVLTRNDRDLALDVNFVISRGERIFVERIDIEGNTTTLDRVVRRQFRTVEGDPFSPAQIRQAAERIRALGYFSNADVQARQGSGPDQVIVDVNVEEQPTGTLSFGVSYGVSSGVGFAVSFSESNFLGRGQFLGVNISSGTDTQSNSITFVEPAFLGRDLRFRFAAGYNTSDKADEEYDTRVIFLQPSIEFPLTENSRLELRYRISEDKMSDYGGDSALIAAETAEGALISSALGYTYTYDTRAGGLDPNSGVLLRFGQDFAGIGGDVEAITTTALASAETKVWNEEVTLRATIEGGALHMLNGNSRAIDRFTGNGRIRGFEPNGLGPRDLTASSEDALGGNLFAVARFEAEFPLGLPEEYGITGGLFLDVGSVWSLDDTLGGTIDDSAHLRSSIGVSVFWTTPIGPLRFNFSKALEKQDYDLEQSFDLTVSTRF